MGKHHAAIVGYTEWPARRQWPEPLFTLEAMARLSAELLADSGLEKSAIDGICIAGVKEAPLFAPAAVAEYLGIESAFNEVIDLGGASACGLVMRAAMAIETGVCSTVLVLLPALPAPPPPPHLPAPSGSGLLYMGGDSWGSPQGQFDIPAGLVAAVPSYAMIAQRYAATYGLDPALLARIAVQQRDNAQHNPNALFYGKTITIDDVLHSRMLADPVRLLDTVMPCYGGGGVIITRADIARYLPRRPVWISGYGEHLSHKSLQGAADLLHSPLIPASARAFAMAGMTPDAVDMASIYDCFTITVLLSLENAGFCAPGQGQAFVRERNLHADGDFPLNTHGGQLSAGQPGHAGALSHVIDAVRQLQGRAGSGQVPNCNRAYCNGNGGMMAEHVVLLLEGE